MNWDGLPRCFNEKDRMKKSGETFYKLEIYPSNNLPKSNLDVLDRCWCLRRCVKSKMFLLSNEFKALFGIKKLLMATRQTEKCIFVYTRVCGWDEEPVLMPLRDYLKENSTISSDLKSQIRGIFGTRALFGVRNNSETTIAIANTPEKDFAISLCENFASDETDYPCVSDYVMKRWFYDDMDFFRRVLLDRLGFLLRVTGDRTVFGESYNSIQRKLDKIEDDLDEIIRRLDAADLSGISQIVKQNIKIHINSF